MGLDQWIYATDVPDGEDDCEKIEIQYWRKHPDLHGFISNLAKKNHHDVSPEDGTINCHPYPLSVDEIRQIIHAIQNDQLPVTKGFFFGESFNDERQKEYDIEAFEEALRYIEKGYEVYYNAWW